MLDKQSKAELAKKQKQKLVVLVLLGGLLIAVLTQPKKDRREADTTEIAISTTALQVAEADSDDDAFEQLSRVQSLPSIALDKALSEDLFAVRETEPVAIEQVVQVPSLDVSAVYISSQSSKRSALINGKFVTVGDVLPDGRRVQSITMDGVQLGR